MGRKKLPRSLVNQAVEYAPCTDKAYDTKPIRAVLFAWNELPQLNWDALYANRRKHQRKMQGDLKLFEDNKKKLPSLFYVRGRLSEHGMKTGGPKKNPYFLAKDAGRFFWELEDWSRIRWSLNNPHNSRSRREIARMTDEDLAKYCWRLFQEDASGTAKLRKDDVYDWQIAYTSWYSALASGKIGNAVMWGRRILWIVDELKPIIRNEHQKCVDIVRKFMLKNDNGQTHQ